MSESDLVRRARQGDSTAWEELVRLHQQAVFRLAYLIAGDAHDAEDVAQEAFIRAFYALDRFDPDRPLRPWLLRICANQARNRRRSLGRRLAALRRLVHAAPDSAVDVEERASKRLKAQTLWQAVRRLDAKDQEVIYLRYFLELSEAETAEALDVAPGTVKSRLSRALGRLRGTVEREFPALWNGESDERAAV